MQRVVNTRFRPGPMWAGGELAPGVLSTDDRARFIDVRDDTLPKPPARVWQEISGEVRGRVVENITRNALRAARVKNRAHLAMVALWGVFVCGIAILQSGAALVASVAFGLVAMATHATAIVQPSIGVECYFACDSSIGVSSTRGALVQFERTYNKHSTWAPRIERDLVRTALAQLIQESDPALIPARTLLYEEAEEYGLRGMIERLCGLGSFEVATSLSRHNRFKDAALSELISVVQRIGEHQVSGDATR